MLPGAVCGLELRATECENITATTCTCEDGYENQEMICIGKTL